MEELRSKINSTNKIEMTLFFVSGFGIIVRKEIIVSKMDDNNVIHFKDKGKRKEQAYKIKNDMLLFEGFTELKADSDTDRFMGNAQINIVSTMNIEDTKAFIEQNNVNKLFDCKHKLMYVDQDKEEDGYIPMY